MKRNLVLATITTFCLSLLLAIFASSPVLANADTKTIYKVAGHKSYTLSYLIEDAGYEYHSDMSVTIGGVSVVKPSDDGVSAESQAQAGFKTTDGSSVIFLAEKEYTLVVTHDDDTFEIIVNTSGKPADDDLYYNLAKRANYEKLVESATKITEDEEVRDIRIDDTYSVPCIADLIVDKYFDVENLTGTLYYATPGSTSYSSKSISDIDSVSFTVTKVGDYKFYLLLKNAFVSITTEDLVECSDGWYTKDDDGEATGKVIVPIFTFHVGEAVEPKITVGHNELAYLNLEYTLNCFTVVGNEPSSYYTLYHSATKIDVPANTDLADQEALEALGLTEVTEENGFTENNLFNSGSTSFIPEESGYYYVVLHVVDEGNEHAYAISEVIDATNELRQVKYETQFFKNNWVSILLLSVAVLCFVAIIIILCYKPKEKVGLTTKK